MLSRLAIDLEVVLHPVVDFADQLALPFQRIAHLAFGFVDPLDRADEGVAKILDLGRRAELRREHKRIVAGLEIANDPLQPAQAGRSASRLTSSQLIRAATTHISTGSRISNRSIVVMLGAHAAILTSSWPLAIG